MSEEIDWEKPELWYVREKQIQKLWHDRWEREKLEKMERERMEQERMGQDAKMLESKEDEITTYPISAIESDLMKNWHYHPPKGDQPQRYQLINKYTQEAAQRVIDYCPPSAEKTLALRALQQARMWANAAIAVHE